MQALQKVEDRRWNAGKDHARHQAEGRCGNSLRIPAWNSYLSGSVDDILSHLNTVDVNEAVLAQFALTKTGGDNFTAFLFTPQGA